MTLGVFSKHWTPGATKTRLAASIGDDAAAAVSRCFLNTTLERLSKAPIAACERVVAYTPRSQSTDFSRLRAVASGSWGCEPQSDGALGERMRRFFEAALQRTSAVMLVGTDSPDLPLNAVVDGIRWLSDQSQGSRLVLGPTDDGGYWLIGARGGLPPIFGEMPWSQPGLMQATLERLKDAEWREGHDYRMLTPWYDVDEGADLERLRNGLRERDPALLRLADDLDALLGPN